ncbi:unknown_gene_9437 [Phodopus roborovskii]|uniref:Unknown_gene_9437 protein n=1 Tax=Phodopus roborovskii TaxID=109678 RepID=A0AAU9Z116_PHORO|nr:unknown_gene_9437 [Phodopus roborovskii]
MSCSSAPHSCSRLYISSNPMKTVSLGSLVSEVRLTSRSASFTLSARITVASLSRYMVADTSWGSSSISANTLSMSAKLANAQHFIPRHRILFWICFSPLSSMANSGWENSSEDGKYLWAIVLNWESKGKKDTSLEEVSIVICSRKFCSSERQMVVGRAIRS